MSKTHHVDLPGSERTAPSGKKTDTLKSNEVLAVTIKVRRKKSIDARVNAADEPVKQLSHEEYLKEYGANTEDLEKVEQFAHEYDLTVLKTDAASRSIEVQGTVSQIQEAFGVQLAHYSDGNNVHRGRSGTIKIPENLSDIVVGVFGIDDRPVAQPRLKVHPAAKATDYSYTPIDIAKIYNFPAGATGAGQTIGIIELGGGYTSKELATYFKSLGISPTPKVTAVSVDGGQNKPVPGSDSPDVEVLLDIEVAAAVAPQANIAVYFAPNTDRGFLDAISAAIHDTKNNPSVVSISWGSAEKNWTTQSLNAFNEAFKTAATLGVTFTVAAGDHGSSDGETDGKVHADFPASSPYVLATGGTHLEAVNHVIQKENVWNDGDGWATGGGVSDFFSLPSYQSAVSGIKSVNTGHKAGRILPDVSGNADNVTGYQILADGQKIVVGGTSAVAPLWAGLIALLNQKLTKKVGFINPLLYQIGSASFHDITTGNNITIKQLGYSAGPGFDAASGWGTPKGDQLLKALQNAVAKNLVNA